MPQDSAKGYAPSQADGDQREERLDTPLPSWSYEETVRQVEAIMTRIESGELELADVFDQFATAVSYLRQCELFLSQRQQQMELLIETLTDDLE
ncbi:MAG: exodeoxyribonuclease VII small subunit [Leptolyngbya sp. BL-A-14]